MLKFHARHFEPGPRLVPSLQQTTPASRSMFSEDGAKNTAPLRTKKHENETKIQSPSWRLLVPAFLALGSSNFI